MSEIRAFVAMTVKPEDLAELQEVVSVFVRDAEAESGTLGLAYAADASGGRVLVQERYVDSAAMLAHLGAMDGPSVARLVELVSIERMDVVGPVTPGLREALAVFGDVTYLESLA